MQDIKIKVPYVSVWDGGVEIETNATLDLSTGEITDIGIINPQDAVEICEREYITLNGVQIDVIADEDSGYWVMLYGGHDGPCTDSYTAHKEVMSSLSIVSIVRAVDYINALSQFLNDDNEILDDMDSVLEPLNEIIVKLRTDEECRHGCGYVYKSDLPQYDSVCPVCDENS